MKYLRLTKLQRTLTSAGALRSFKKPQIEQVEITLITYQSSAETWHWWHSGDPQHTSRAATSATAQPAVAEG